MQHSCTKAKPGWPHKTGVPRGGAQGYGVAVGQPLLTMMCPRSLRRNLSSASQQTRQKMRECHGLVDAMIHYVNSSLEVGKSEDKVSPGAGELGAAPSLLQHRGAKAHLEVTVGKPVWLLLGLLAQWGTHCRCHRRGSGRRGPGDAPAGDALAGGTRTDPLPHVSPQSVENAVCVLRNLSYRLYDEMPPSSLQRLEGHRRNGGMVTGELVGCFSPQSKKAREVSSWEGWAPSWPCQQGGAGVGQRLAWR